MRRISELLKLTSCAEHILCLYCKDANNLIYLFLPSPSLSFSLPLFHPPSPSLPPSLPPSLSPLFWFPFGYSSLSPRSAAKSRKSMLLLEQWQRKSSPPSRLWSLLAGRIRKERSEGGGGRAGGRESGREGTCAEVDCAGHSINCSRLSLPEGSTLARISRRDAPNLHSCRTQRGEPLLSPRGRGREHTD